MTSTPRRISILGSTGSIGVNTLDAMTHMGGRHAFDVVALTGAGNIDLLAAQARTWNAQIAVTADDSRLGDLRTALSGTGIDVGAGRQALLDAAAIHTDLTMAAIVGMAGLEPTLAAARNGGTIALANKECLVAAGRLFLDEVRLAGATLLPVDSEHNAIFQVFETGQRSAIERIILTASGGPFRSWPVEKMRNVTADVARQHPNWSMGLKISIDSASMFNKALEMIEAQHLFDMDPGAVEVIVHPQSIVHSMVGYQDGSILAQLGPSDMRTAIGYCLGWPDRPAMPVEKLDFHNLAKLEFEAPDESRFPALRLARDAMTAGHASGTILNSAKEVALDAFIDGRIGFLDIATTVEAVLERLGPLPAASLGAIFEADRLARAEAIAVIG